MSKEPTMLTEETLYQSVNRLNIPEEQKAFLRQLVAVTHNNALRTYELSCIMDGVLFAIREKGLATNTELQNYVQLATAIKEFHGETGQVLSLTQAIDKFLGNDFVLGEKKIQIRTPDFLPSDQPTPQNKGENQDDRNKVH